MNDPIHAPIEPVADGDLALRLPAPAEHDPLRGILLLAGGVLVFAAMDTTTKVLVASHPVPVVVAMRYVVNCLLMVAVLGPSQGRRLLETRRTGLVVLRGVFLALASIFSSFALTRLPVAESTSLIFLMPTIVMLLAGPLLGERIGRLGWIAAVAGFAGVLLIARPGAGLEPVGVVLALATAAVTAAYQLLSRELAGSERTMTLLFYTALLGALVFGLAAPWFWDGRVPGLLDLALFLSLGIYSGIGHYMFTAAHRFAPASLLAPIGYLQVVWAGLFGWAVFGHVPTILTLAGMGVIVVSGTLIALKSRFEGGRPA